MPEVVTIGDNFAVVRWTQSSDTNSNSNSNSNNTSNGNSNSNSNSNNKGNNKGNTNNSKSNGVSKDKGATVGLTNMEFEVFVGHVEPRSKSAEAQGAGEGGGGGGGGGAGGEKYKDLQIRWSRGETREEPDFIKKRDAEVGIGITIK